ncbi:hypothetical protein D3C77_235430 [compost metagenome]
MRDGAGRGEVGFAPLLVGGHGRGHLVQLLEVFDPEVFIDVDVPVVALGGAAVGTEEAQLCPWLAIFAQDDGVAGELQAEPFLGERDDVAAEDLGLRPTGRQEHLVVPGKHRIHEGFTGEVVGEAHLTGLENVADPGCERVLFGLEQLFLVAKHLADELVEEVHLGEPGNVVLGRLLFLAFTALASPLLTSLTPLAPRLLTALAISRFGLRHWGGRLCALPGQAFTLRDQAVELVLLGLTQYPGFLIQQGDSTADGRQRLLVGEHVLPSALPDPVVDDPDVRQPKLRLDFLRLAAAQKQTFGGFFDFV